MFLNKGLILLSIFLLAFSVRIWSIHDAGRTWDEIAYVDVGQKYIELLKRGDLTSNLWYKYADILPLPRYIYGISAQLDVRNFSLYGESIYSYDFSYSRLISVVLSTFTVILVVLIGLEYFSPFIAVTAGIILSLLPYYLGLSQRVTIETVQFFFFTLCVYMFLGVFKRFTVHRAAVAGLLLGISLQGKYTNVLLIPLFFLMFGYHLYTTGQKKILSKSFFKKLAGKNVLILFLASFLSFVLLWPMPYFHIAEIWTKIYNQRFSESIRPPPELFFGSFGEVPKYYYVVYLFITTPLAILIFWILGLFSIHKKYAYIGGMLLLWFSVPFLQSFYNFRQNGIRYIIEIYAPLSVFAAVGFDHLIRLIKLNRLLRYFSLGLLIVYMILALNRVAPYYLNYYNEIVGSTKGVYESRLFPIGWWGDGMKEASKYINSHAKKGEHIGLQLDPIHTYPKNEDLIYESYNSSHTYSYVVVNDYSITRQFFKTAVLTGKYKLVYKVVVDHSPLVLIYKLK